jgi:hypothetical protein
MTTTLRYSRHGRSRGGLMEYRRCRRCGERYVVEPIGAEVLDDGAASSRIVTGQHQRMSPP